VYTTFTSECVYHFYHNTYNLLSRANSFLRAKNYRVHYKKVWTFDNLINLNLSKENKRKPFFFFFKKDKKTELNFDLLLTYFRAIFCLL